MRLLSCLVLAIALTLAANGQAAMTSDPDVPQVWQHLNALRTVDLSGAVARETVAVVLENVSKKPQSVYYLPVSAGSRQSVIEVKEKGKTAAEAFTVTREAAHWVVQLPSPIAAGEQITLNIGLATFDTLTPRPSKVEQNGKQYLQWRDNVHVYSAYTTLKQKTKFKLPSDDVPAASDGGQIQGSTVTYGPYEKLEPGASKVAELRFESSQPLAVVRSVAREIEVSHWGGNIAFEDSYSLTNHAAELAKPFDRIAFAQSAYYNPRSTAVRAIGLRLPAGTRDAYFVDEIGNVSTSRFRSSPREAVLELKPRYPIFGGWNYTFTVGWNNDLKRYLKRTEGSLYQLHVPFLEGPDKVDYQRASVQITLPEGAVVREHRSKPRAAVRQGVKRTFGDTIGRTTLTFETQDLTGESARGEVYVVYEYTTAAALRKPIVLVTAIAALFLLRVVASKVI